MTPPPALLPASVTDLRPGGLVSVLGLTAWRHADRLVTLAASHDGALVAGAGADVWLWSSVDGALSRRLSGLPSVVHALGWSDDDALLATAYGPSLAVWSVRDGQRLRTHDLGPVHTITSDRDGGFFAVTARDKGLRVLRLRPDGRDEPVAALLGEVERAALSRDGRWLAVSWRGLRPGEVSLYALPTLRLAHTLLGPAEFSYEEETRDFWGEPCTEIRTVQVSLRALAFDPAGGRLVSGGNEPVVRCWNVERGALLAELPLDARDTAALTFDHAGQRVAISHGPLVGWPGPVKLWNPSTAALLTLHGVREQVAGFTRDDARLLVGGRGHKLQVFDAGEGTRIDDPDDPGDAPTSLGISPDGETLLTRTNTRLLARSLRDGSVLWQRPLWEQSNAPIGSAPDGATAFTPDVERGPGSSPSSVFGVRGFRLRDGEAGEVYAPVPTLVWSLDVSPDGAWLATAGHRRDVDLWRVEDHVVGATLAAEVPHAVAFFPDGRGAVVTESNGQLLVFVWEGAPSGRLTPTRVLEPSTPASATGPHDAAFRLCLSRDGRLALSSFADVVRLWDLDAGTNPLASPVYDRLGHVYAVSFDRDDRPQGLVGVPLSDARGQGTSLRHWSPEGTVEVSWRHGRWRLYTACAAFLPGGEGFVLVGDDGVARVHRSPGRVVQNRSR